MCAAIALAISGVSAASAATIQQEITFSAFDFAPYFGDPVAPIDPFEGSLIVSYDPDAETGPTTTGIEIISLNFPFSQAAFSYAIVGDGVLAVGTKPSAGAGFAITEVGDFGFTIDNIRTAPKLGYAQYWSNAGNYYTFTGTVEVAGVPEPTTWAIAIVGMGLAGGALRRHRRASPQTA